MFADNVVKHDLVWLGDVTRDEIETIKWDMPGIKAIDFCPSVFVVSDRYTSGIFDH